MSQPIENSVRQFIKENLLYRESTEPLENDTSFLEAGLIDSTGILQLVTFLEENFAIRVADSEVVPENMDSISRIVKYVQSKVDAQGAGNAR